MDQGRDSMQTNSLGLDGAQDGTQIPHPGLHHKSVKFVRCPCIHLENAGHILKEDFAVHIWVAV